MRTPLVRGSTLVFASALMVFGAASSHAQRSRSEGFLFHEPDARLTLRAGYAAANAGSDLFAFTEKQLTLNKGDFSGFTLGGEVAVPISSRFELSLDAGWSRSSKRSEFRNFVDNNNLPIEQTTTFNRVPLTMNTRYNFVDAGRKIGRLAWIPSKVVPWVGGGAGLMWYKFEQQGDFVDFKTNGVFPATLNSDGFSPMIQGMAGLDVSLTPGVALTADARYMKARDDLSGDFVGYKPIDLSGVSVTLGLTFRM